MRGCMHVLYCECSVCGIRNWLNISVSIGIWNTNMNLYMKEWPLCQTKGSDDIPVFVLLYPVSISCLILQCWEVNILSIKLDLTVWTMTYTIDRSITKSQNVQALHVTGWQQNRKQKNTILPMWEVYHSIACWVNMGCNAGIVKPAVMEWKCRIYHVLYFGIRGSDVREVEAWQLGDIVKYKYISLEMGIVAFSKTPTARNNIKNGVSESKRNWAVHCITDFNVWASRWMQKTVKMMIKILYLKHNVRR